MSITLDEVIKAVLVNFYWETVPQPTRQGAGIFVNYLMDHLRGPGVMRNARDAASQCSAPWVENATLLQRRLREALVDFYKQSARPHPRIEDQARAFAETVIAEVGPQVESAALRQVTRRRLPGRRRLLETGLGREGRYCIHARQLKCRAERGRQSCTRR
jgi:hypothetical protein